jgi:hypothetical protein
MEGQPMTIGLTPDEFRALLWLAIDDSIAIAQREVADPLPWAVRLQLLAFEQDGHESTCDAVFARLYRGGAFPRIVDVFVVGLAGSCTIVALRPSGHPYTRNVAETWSASPAMGPFKSLGLRLPVQIRRRPRHLSLRDLEEAAPAWARGAKG